jgi:hypothetical protein
MNKKIKQQAEIAVRDGIELKVIKNFTIPIEI